MRATAVETSVPWTAGFSSEERNRVLGTVVESSGRNRPKAHAQAESHDGRLFGDCVEKLFGSALRQSFGGLQTINSLTIVECVNSEGPTFLEETAAQASQEFFNTIGR